MGQSKSPIASASGAAMPTSQASFRFVDETHRESARKAAQGERDCCVVAGALRVPAHRDVLVQFSLYFESQLHFQELQRTASQSEFKIDYQGMNEQCVESLVGFAYSGELDITYASVRDLLRAADFLCVSSVSTACCEYISEALSETNLHDVRQFAEDINCEQLMKHIRIFVARNFTRFSAFDILLSIKPQLLIEILNNDELVVTKKYGYKSSVSQFFVMEDEQEEMLVRLIVRYEEKTRSGALPQLLKEGIRLCLISTPALIALKTEKLVAASPECLALLDRAAEIKGLGAAAGVESSDGGARGGELDRDELYRRWTSPRSLSGLETEETPEFATEVLARYEMAPRDCEPFDDVTPGVHYVTGMKLYARRWDQLPVIGGMLVKYSSGKQLLHGSDDYGYEVGEFDLDPDERVVKVIAYTGWMVDGLGFVTSRGRTLGPWGGQGGSRHDLTAPGRSGYLAHVAGVVETTKSQRAVRHLRFVWTYNRHDCEGGD